MPKAAEKSKVIAFFQTTCPQNGWPIIGRVLEDPDFQRWSGAGSKEKHHYGTGGLFQHTYEVGFHSWNIGRAHTKLTGQALRMFELIVAAVWHDFGKMWDYQEKDGVWGKFNHHAREIHHICRSAIEFQKFITSRIELPDGFDIDHVTHMILAHHGRREWGSPVAPHTQEAWILQTADNISARLNDYATHKPF